MNSSVVIIKKYSKGFQKKPLFVIVGKSVLKKSTDRNLVKRRIRAIMAKFIKEGRNDYAVIIKKGVLEKKYGELKENIESAIKYGRTIS